MSFGSRAEAAIAAYGPACIGIDPHAALLEAWGLGDDLHGLERFAATCVEAFAGHVGFVKPQSAFFERFGARGVAVLERTLQDLRHTGTLTILDVKRGDIGSTAAAYAQAYLDEDSPMAADAVTVTPYLGTGSLDPFFDVAARHDAGVFVLALTSNPEGPQVQHARTADGTVAGEVLAQVRELNAQARRDGAAGAELGPFGVVVGATIGGTEEDLDVGGPVLAPGFGSQGGTVEDLDRIFVGAVRRHVLPSTSRQVLAAGPDVAALREAALAVNATCRR